MDAKGLNPILNVSNLEESFTWFSAFGWRKLWDWGEPATFGAVGSGSDCCLFLCLDAQGGRGRGANTTTFTHDGDERADRGVWLSVWVDDADKIHRDCLAAGLDVTFGPADMPWGAREVHVRHPDGHVFRVSQNVAKASQNAAKVDSR